MWPSSLGKREVHKFGYGGVDFPLCSGKTQTAVTPTTQVEGMDVCHITHCVPFEHSRYLGSTISQCQTS